MTAHPPPVPPEQRNPHATTAKPDTGAEKANRTKGEDPSGRGRQQNLTENMANKGHQQDR